MSKSKKVIICVCILISIIILTMCSYLLIKELLEYNEVNNDTNELIEDIIIENENQDEVMTIDWDKLKNINKDIIGWIKIEDTNINYPILKDSDLYYLNHTYEKKSNSNGSIFTKTTNPFIDKETIVYGHNMRNNIMFSEIEEFMDEEFFYNHLSFMIYTEECNYCAKVFSIYSIGVNEESENIKSFTIDEKIEYYQKQSKFYVEKINKQANIVKLSTCSYLNNKTRPTNQRYFLIAYLEKIE